MLSAKRQFHALPWNERYEPDTNGGCWLWLGSVNKGPCGGYGAMTIKGLPKAAHRAFYSEFVGPIPDGMEVCHKCDVRCCVNPQHLFIGTKSDNQRDCVRKGRKNAAKGEDNGDAVLTETQVLRMYSDTRAQGLIAAEYGVDRTTVNLIQSGKKWQWLTCNLPRVERQRGPWTPSRVRLVIPERTEPLPCHRQGPAPYRP